MIDKETHTITLDGGKYTIHMNDDGTGFERRRYNDPWTSCAGDNLLYFMFLRIKEQEEKLLGNIPVDALRKLVLSGRSSELEKYILTPSQLSTVRSVAKGTIRTSTDFAELNGTTIQNASMQLKTLFNKGYLDRIEVGDPTGGTMYEYSAR